MTNNDYNLLTTILKMRQTSLYGFMSKLLLKFYKEEQIYKTDEYLLAVGTTPIMLVAHLDTVFEIPPQQIFYDQKQHIMWSPQGLGADDRAGIFSIIKILQKGYLPTVCFTTDEEIGGIGSIVLSQEIKKPFFDVKYIIELDRQGKTDCVFYGCKNEKFQQYIEGFGFTTAIGTFTDISNICPNWGIAGVNLSVGYINEHSTKELLNTADTYLTINKVCKMLDEADKAQSFEYIGSTENPYSEAILAYFGNKKRCTRCQKFFSDDDVFPVKPKTKRKEAVYYCLNCVSWGVSWCRKCGQPFETKKYDDVFCEECAHVQQNRTN